MSMKCKECGSIDETNTAYCINCGRSPHVLIEQNQLVIRRETKNNFVVYLDPCINNVFKYTIKDKLFSTSSLPKAMEKINIFLQHITVTHGMRYEELPLKRKK